MSLLSNKLERVICSMVRSSVGGHNTLDLTADEARPIKASLDEIAALYVVDFPAIPASTPGVVLHSATTEGGAGGNESVLTVGTHDAPLTSDAGGSRLSPRC